MMSKLYSIAGLTVQMTVENRTAAQAEPYRLEGEAQPDITLVGTHVEYQKRRPYLTYEEAEYINTCREFCYRLLDFEGFVLHSSAVVVDNRAYLFSALSGTGKSTHTELWLKKFGDRAYILNDDKPAIRLIDGVWHACGTPWSGKYDISRPACVPLAGIAFLNRDTTNHIERYTGPMMTYDLLSQTLRHPKKLDMLITSIDKLASAVPVWKLFCNMEPEAAEVSYNAMSGNVKE
jgi:hypothetical protein